VVMCMTYDDMDYNFEQVTEKINWFFTFFFTGEAIVKLFAFGSTYFRYGDNKFDFVIVLTSLLDIGVSFISKTELESVGISAEILKLLKVLRVARILRLLNKIKSLKPLLETITFSISSLINVFALLMLVMFIFSILGVFLFSDVTTGMAINEEFNFKNFGNAFVLLFRMSTGEDWPTVMRDLSNTSSTCIPKKTCGTIFSSIYYLFFQIIVYYVLLNLFILIILQQFDMYYFNTENVLASFGKDLIKFKETWLKYSTEHSGIKIPSDRLTQFFKDLEGNLGMSNESDKDIIKLTTKMSIQGDDQGFVFFNEMLFKTMKRIYGTDRTRKKKLRD
jgi:hypothetical protein